MKRSISRHARRPTAMSIPICAEVSRVIPSSATPQSAQARRTRRAIRASGAQLRPHIAPGSHARAGAKAGAKVSHRTRARCPKTFFRRVRRVQRIRRRTLATLAEIGKRTLAARSLQIGKQGPYLATPQAFLRSRRVHAKSSNPADVVGKNVWRGVFIAVGV